MYRISVTSSVSHRPMMHHSEMTDNPFSRYLAIKDVFVSGMGYVARPYFGSRIWGIIMIHDTLPNIYIIIRKVDNGG